VYSTAGNRSNVYIANDLVSNTTFLDGTRFIYFEGNNILVRIVGTSSMPAVLLSAHFDSVSTAPGATDDGMGVATLLQLLDYFAQNTPKRDIIFNINNAEEDGLLGARALVSR
jgi:Zn-dependent M28 family amino/carboxypeptidase